MKVSVWLWRESSSDRFVFSGGQIGFDYVSYKILMNVFFHFWVLCCVAIYILRVFNYVAQSVFKPI